MKFFRDILFTAFVLCVMSNCYSQGVWTWVTGDIQTFGSTNIGTKGIAAPGNNARRTANSATWTDTAGRFWVYSGDDLDYMFMFDPHTLMWTWVFGTTYPYNKKIAAAKGVFDPGNSPGHLTHMATWITPDNHFWLYSGSSDYYVLNDAPLWQYDPAINQWAWMGNFGPKNHGTLGVLDTNNMPGRRTQTSCCWTDGAGDLWLFGGFANGAYNDMWKYGVSTGIWTWMSGSKDTSNPGVYGQRGIPSTNIYPPARMCRMAWKDSSGNFWLAGGADHLNKAVYQDVWKFNPGTLEWTWIYGSRGPDASLAKGTQCTFDVNSKIGPRHKNTATWVLCNDLAINYAGDKTHSFDSSYNDLWAYSMSRNEWILLNSWPLTTAYGTKGVPDIATHPCSRSGSAAFKDKENNLWLFGGNGLNNRRNDLWKYVIDSSCLGPQSCFSGYCSKSAININATDTLICSNENSTICGPTGFSSYLWSHGSTSRCVQVNGAGNYYLITRDKIACPSVSNRIQINTYPAPSVSTTVNGDTIRAYNANNYQWLRNGMPIIGATDSIFIIAEPGSYSVEIVDSNGCKGVSNQVTFTSISQTQDGSKINVHPNPARDYIQVRYTGDDTNIQVEIFNAVGQKVYSRLFIESQVTDVSLFPAGVYMLFLKQANSILAVRKIIKE